MARTPIGTVASVATAFATALAFTAASNAAETVLTVTGATLVAGDLVEVTSTWGQLSGRIFRVKTATATAITLEGCNTTSTILYPAGSGTGSLRKINTWVPLTQQLEINSTGGDAKMVNYQYVETGTEQQAFDGFSATNYTISLDAEAIGGAAYTALQMLTDTQTISALRMMLPNGSAIYMSCTAALNENPSVTKGAIMANPVTFFGRGKVVRYAS
jgi:hypothetical protein